MEDQNFESQQPMSEATGKKLVDLLSHTPISTAQKSIEIVKKPFIHLRQSQLLAGFIGTIGFVMFAFGLESLMSSLPILSSSAVKIFLGILIMTVSGLAIKKLS